MQLHHPSFEGEAHNLVSNIIFLGRFPTKVLHFLWLKLHSAASKAPRLYWSAETPRWRKTKWRESIQLETDTFCGNCGSSWSLKSSWYLSGTLYENLEMRGVEETIPSFELNAEPFPVAISEGSHSSHVAVGISSKGTDIDVGNVLTHLR